MGGLRAEVARFCEAVVVYFAPDVETTDPGCGTVRGAEPWRAYGEAVKQALPDARLKFQSAMESGDAVAVEGRFTGPLTAPLITPQGAIPSTGRMIDVPYADVFTLRDGQIEAHRGHQPRLGLEPSRG